MLSSLDNPLLLSRLDLWVAATMDSCATLERHCALAGVSLADAEEVRLAAEAAGIRPQMIELAHRVVAFFGTPAISRADRLVYNLALWPAHQFIWAVNRWGDTCPVGMRLRTAELVPRLSGRTLEEARARFLPWLHTEHEVRCVLGAPDRETARGHKGCWLYQIPGGRWLRFSFQWSLLRELRLVGSAADDHSLSGMPSARASTVTHQALR